MCRERNSGGGGGRVSGPGGGGSGATVLIELEAPLKKGDGLVFDRGQPEEREEGRWRIIPSRVNGHF